MKKLLLSIIALCLTGGLAFAALSGGGTGTATGNQLSNVTQDSQGNIGIGTTTPVYAMDVTGTTRSYSFRTANALGGVTSTLGWGINPNQGTTDVFRVNAAGNVGINTLSPAYNLEVIGSSKDTSHVTIGPHQDYVHIPGEEVITSATSITPTGNYSITYQNNTQTGGTLTINAPSPTTPAEGQSWELIIKSTNVQTFSWNSVYTAGGGTLPTATTGSSKIDKYTFQYDTVNSKFDYTGTATGF